MVVGKYLARDFRVLLKDYDDTRQLSDLVRSMTARERTLIERPLTTTRGVLGEADPRRSANPVTSKSAIWTHERRYICQATEE